MTDLLFCWALAWPITCVSQSLQSLRGDNVTRDNILNVVLEKGSSHKKKKGVLKKSMYIKEHGIEPIFLAVRVGEHQLPLIRMPMR